jgi:hypothetical protein
MVSGRQGGTANAGRPHRSLCSGSEHKGTRALLWPKRRQTSRSRARMIKLRAAVACGGLRAPLVPPRQRPRAKLYARSNSQTHLRPGLESTQGADTEGESISEAIANVLITCVCAWGACLSCTGIPPDLQ